MLQNSICCLNWLKTQYSLDAQLSKPEISLNYLDMYSGILSSQLQWHPLEQEGLGIFPLILSFVLFLSYQNTLLVIRYG